MSTSKRSTIREDVAALGAAYETGHNAVLKEFGEIVKRLDQINGNVRRHDSWIAGREPICAQSAENLHALSTAVQTITTLLSEQRGEGKAKARMAKVVNMAVIAATAIGSAWAGIHVAVSALPHP